MWISKMVSTIISLSIQTWPSLGYGWWLCPHSYAPRLPSLGVRALRGARHNICLMLAWSIAKSQPLAMAWLILPQSYSCCHLLASTTMYSGSTSLYFGCTLLYTWVYYTLPLLYFTLLHPIMTLLGSTTCYHFSICLYVTLQWLYLALLDSNSLYYSCTFLYNTLPNIHLPLLHSAISLVGSPTLLTLLDSMSLYLSSTWRHSSLCSR